MKIAKYLLLLLLCCGFRCAREGYFVQVNNTVSQDLIMFAMYSGTQDSDREKNSLPFDDYNIVNAQKLSSFEFIKEDFTAFETKDDVQKLRYNFYFIKNSHKKFLYERIKDGEKYYKVTVIPKDTLFTKISLKITNSSDDELTFSATVE